MEGPVLGSFSGSFSLFRNSDRLLVPSAGQKIPVQPGWYLQQQKILLAENRFLQVRELKIHRKNPGSAFRIWKPAAVISFGRRVDTWHLRAQGYVFEEQCLRNLAGKVPFNCCGKNFIEGKAPPSIYLH
jgi:hypothetical protein